MIESFVLILNVCFLTIHFLLLNQSIPHQVTNTLNENKIKELEQKLSEERERVVQLEQESIKLFEAEEELAKLRNELSTTQGQDQSTSEGTR